MTRDIKRDMMLLALYQCIRERIVQKCDCIHGMSLRVRGIIEDLVVLRCMRSRGFLWRPSIINRMESV